MKRWAIALVVFAGCAAPLQQKKAPPPFDLVTFPQDDPLTSSSAAMARLVEKIRPSVVTVDVTSGIHTEVEYFRNGGQTKPAPSRRLHRRRDGSYRADGAGSGVVYAEGLVMTNAHVVAGASDIKVSQDEETWDAELVGIDPLADVAVLRVKKLTCKPAALGDSDALRMGDWVVALGDPFIFKRSVTFGIVSSKGRADVGLARYEDFIQVDCAINPGNSGGALVNMKGEVVGINTGYYSEGQGFSGVGLAIPVNQAAEIAKTLEKKGRVSRGSLGVDVQDLNGVVVTESDGSSSFEPGDIIASVNGKAVGTVRDYFKTVAKLVPGEKAKVTRKRGGREEEIEAPLVEQSVPDWGHDSWFSPALGLGVQELTPWLAKELGRKGEKGVIVSRADPEFLPDLKVGDIIQKVGRKKVATVKEFQAEAEGDEPGDFYVLTARGAHTFVSPPR